jgi:hypothetical protein
MELGKVSASMPVWLGCICAGLQFEFQSIGRPQVYFILTSASPQSSLTNVSIKMFFFQGLFSFNRMFLVLIQSSAYLTKILMQFMAIPLWMCPILSDLRSKARLAWLRKPYAASGICVVLKFILVV